MIHERRHTRQRSFPPHPGRSRNAYRRCLRFAGLVLLSTAGLAACGADGTTDPAALRFGQLGSIRVQLESPRRGAGGVLRAGSLNQLLTWESDGSWTLVEAISYRGLQGDEDRRRSAGDASLYAALITQVNEVTGQKLLDEVPEAGDPPPECGPTRTRATFQLKDDVRNEQRTWVACVDGSLENLVTSGAQPFPQSSRVALAIQLARNWTLGEEFSSRYAGSVPFGTLDRGGDSNSGLIAPRVILDQGDWNSFWSAHTAGVGQPPEVDFGDDFVLVGIAGPREEAGDSIEVRRILQVDLGTLAEVYVRGPGDFCSPASQVHVPYHIVVSPRTPLPVQFADVRVERVPCGS